MSFQPGDRVFRVADGRVGIVRPSNVPDHCKVFFAPGDEPHVPLGELRPLPDGWHVCEDDQLRRHLLAIKFERPLQDNLYSVNASRARFEVYQFKPALKFFDGHRHRLLIADEVGLGKTIEAGIIYSELNARNVTPLDRVLVVCPSGLKEKWRDELLRRFGEEFQVVNASTLRERMKRLRAGGRRRFKLICPLETIRLRDVALDVEETINSLGMNLDLTIIDEAHHLRNPATLAHDIGEQLAAVSDNLLLLTATPVQLGREDLYHLLSLLDEELFPTFQVFDDAVRPNLHVNRLIECLRRRDILGAKAALAELRRVASTEHFRSSPFLGRVESFLANPDTTSQALMAAVRDAKELNTLAGLVTRTRKREVQDHVAIRDPHVVQVKLSEPEEEYYRAVGEYTRAQASSSSWGAETFAVITRERQAASCIPASLEYFKESLGADDVDLGLEGWVGDEWLGANEQPALPARDVRPISLQKLIEKGRRCTSDSKFQEFCTELRQSLAADESRKVLVFSFFKRTLRYLERELKKLGIVTIRIDGDVPTFQRAKDIQRFKDGPIRVMLSSEVGAEGLDFQFCDTLFNYDLPWNPMRVEQRIGRLDRYGQVSDRIVIKSLVLGGTIEERILYRLYERVGVFRDTIGELEPILGPIVLKVEKEVFSRNLSRAEEERVLRDALDALSNRSEEMKALSTRIDEFLGSDDLVAEVRDRQRTGLTVTHADVRECVQHFVERQHHTRITPLAARPGVFQIRRSPGLSAALFQYCAQQGLAITEEQSEFIGRVGSEDPWLIFDGERATEARYAAVQFVGVGHPLFRLALGAARREKEGLEGPPVYRVQLALPGRPAGLHMFVLRYNTIGARSGSQLVPVLWDGTRWLDESFARDVFGALRDGRPARICLDDPPTAFEEIEEQAMLQAAAYRRQLYIELADRNQAVIEARRSSIESNLRSRITRRAERLAKEREPRIVRMLESEIRNLEARLQHESDRLTDLSAVSVDFQLELRIMIENSASAQPVTVPAALQALAR